MILAESEIEKMDFTLICISLCLQDYGHTSYILPGSDLNESFQQHLKLGGGSCIFTRGNFKTFKLNSDQTFFFTLVTNRDHEVIVQWQEGSSTTSEWQKGLQGPQNCLVHAGRGAEKKPLPFGALGPIRGIIPTPVDRRGKTRVWFDWWKERKLRSVSASSVNQTLRSVDFRLLPPSPAIVGPNGETIDNI